MNLPDDICDEWLSTSKNLIDDYRGGLDKLNANIFYRDRFGVIDFGVFKREQNQFMDDVLMIMDMK